MAGGFTDQEGYRLNVLTKLNILLGANDNNSNYY